MFLTPILGAIIALSTNWLAIRMLFRPHHEKRIFGIRVPFTPGLIPKERERLTKKLAEAISTKLLTPDVISSELADPTIWPLPDKTLGEVLSDFGITEMGDFVDPIGSKLKTTAETSLPKIINAIKDFDEVYPEIDEKLSQFTFKLIDENIGKLAGMFISKEKIYKSIKDGFKTYVSNEENHPFILDKIQNLIDEATANEKIKEAIAEKIFSFNIKTGLTEFLTKEKHAVTCVLQAFASYLAANLPIRTMIENKMNDFDIKEMEEIILGVVGRELKVIVMLGGILGFIIGLVALI